eukprot:1933336-Rhodomonas_salina.1
MPGTDPAMLLPGPTLRKTTSARVLSAGTNLLYAYAPHAVLSGVWCYNSRSTEPGMVLPVHTAAVKVFGSAQIRDGE